MYNIFGKNIEHAACSTFFFPILHYVWSTAFVSSSIVRTYASIDVTEQDTCWSL